MEIKNPEYILEIARQQNVTRAAEKLFVTQSTLSQYLLKIESDLETPLFTRAKGSLIPTDAGRLYLQAAEAIVQIQNTALDSIASLKNEGCIRLGVSSLWGMQLVSDILPFFRENFPTITLKIYENRHQQLVAMLQSGKLDVALMATANPEDLVAFPLTHLRKEELVLILPQRHPFCVSNPLRHQIKPEELAQQLRGCNFILSDEGSTIRHVQEKMFASLFFYPNVVCELNNNRTTLNMVAAGAGIAFVPADYIRELPDIRGFHFQPPLYRDNVLAFRKDLEKTPVLTLLESNIVAHPLFQ